MDPQARATFNLKGASILLVERGTMDMDILVQIMVGFGAKNFSKCHTMDEAKAAVAKTEFDLMIIDAVLGDEDGYELVRWIRREAAGANRFAPLIVVSPHTQTSRVARARDCGAHFLIAKPLRPMVLLERILWVAREKRPFVSTERYAGPDRRFKFEGPPPGSAGRRSDDLGDLVGDAKEPNMSQDQIDALMQPQKVSL